MRRAVAVLLAVIALGTTAACTADTRSSAAERPTTTAAARPDFALAPYRGLGTWIDVFDYVPAFQRDGRAPNVTPESIDDVAGLGVRTLFLQVAIDDQRAERPIVAPALVDAMVRRARRLGVSVVAWYLPKFADVNRDLEFATGIVDHRVDGLPFDGFAVDIEWTESVPDTAERNARLVDFSRRLREYVGSDQKLGAIVYPAVQIEVVNRSLWPDFPYRELDRFYDVWLPMAYWTFRNGDYRDAYRYTEESIRRLRRNLENADANVHPVGGIGDEATVADYDGFLRAVNDTNSIGWSIYDFDTTRSSHWHLLRAPA